MPAAGALKRSVIRVQSVRQCIDKYPCQVVARVYMLHVEIITVGVFFRLVKCMTRNLGNNLHAHLRLSFKKQAQRRARHKSHGVI